MEAGEDVLGGSAYPVLTGLHWHLASPPIADLYKLVKIRFPGLTVGVFANIFEN